MTWFLSYRPTLPVNSDVVCEVSVYFALDHCWPQELTNKKAQLSLGKMHYSLYSSCCSMTFKVIQGRFSFHLKGRMRFSISDQ